MVRSRCSISVGKWKLCHRSPGRFGPTLPAERPIWFSIPPEQEYMRYYDSGSLGRVCASGTSAFLGLAPRLRTTGISCPRARLDAPTPARTGEQLERAPLASGYVLPRRRLPPVAVLSVCRAAGRRLEPLSLRTSWTTDSGSTNGATPQSALFASCRQSVQLQTRRPS